MTRPRKQKQIRTDEVTDDQLRRLVDGTITDDDLLARMDGVPDRSEEGRDSRAANPVQIRKEKRPTILDEVDLHGMKVDEATAILRACMKRWKGREGHYRVIVGKGSHSHNGVGVLRDVVPRWLDAHARPAIAEWRWGKRGEGGDGVLIVRMRSGSSKKSASGH